MDFIFAAASAGNRAPDDVKDFFGPRLRNSVVKYDAGPENQRGGRIQFCRYFSAEVESASWYNSIKSITGSPSTERERGERAATGQCGCSHPLERKFVPYCGFGFGGTTSILT